jgi:hypothetical protein
VGSSSSALFFKNVQIPPYRGFRNPEFAHKLIERRESTRSDKIDYTLASFVRLHR